MVQDWRGQIDLPFDYDFGTEPSEAKPLKRLGIAGSQWRPNVQKKHPAVNVQKDYRNL